MPGGGVDVVAPAGGDEDAGPGAVVVDPRPRVVVGATVVVDGRRLGHAPDRFTLQVGRHDVAVEHASGRWSGRVEIEENEVTTLDVELEAPRSRTQSRRTPRASVDLAFDAATEPNPRLPLYQDFTWGFSASLWVSRNRSLHFGLLYGALSSGNHHRADHDENSSPRPFLFHRGGLGLKFHVIGDPSLYVHAFGAMGFGQVALGAETIWFVSARSVRTRRR